MNDLTPVYAAVGGILKDQRKEIDLAIEEQKRRIELIVGLLEESQKTGEESFRGMESFLKTAIDLANERIHSVEESLKEIPRAGDVSKVFDAIKKDLEDQANDFVAVAERLEQADQKILSLTLDYQQTVQGLATKDQLNQEAAAIAVGLETTQADVQGLREGLEAQSGEIDTVTERIDRAEKNLLSIGLEHSEKIEKLASKEELEEQGEKIAARIEVAQSKAADLVSGLTERFDNEVAKLRSIIKEHDQARFDADEEVRKQADESIAAAQEAFADAVASIRKDISELTDAWIDIQEHGARLEDITPLKADIERLKKLKDELEQKLSGKLVHRHLDEYAKNVDVAMEELQDSLEGQISKVKTLVETIERTPGPRGEKGEQGERGEPGQEGLGVNIKYWQPDSVVRSGEFRMSGLGKLYRAVKDTAKKPGPNDDWERIGAFGFEFQGVRDKDATYEVGDIYVDAGSAFLVLPDDKVKMLCQRGRDGKDGERGPRGPKGKDGLDAAQIAEIKASVKGMLIAMSDGTLHEVPVSGIDAMVEGTVREKLLMLEEEAKQYGTLTKVYRGVWLSSESYREGDLVNAGRGLYLCHKSVGRGERMTDENWVKIAGLGGGRGGSIGVPMNTASPFNVVTLNAAIPAQGAGAGDTYFSFEDNLIRVWDAANARWVYPRGMVQEVTDEAAVSTAPNAQPGMLRWARAEGTLWVRDGGSNSWRRVDTIDIAANDQALAALTPTNRDGAFAYQADTHALFVAEGGTWNQVSGGGVQVVANIGALNGLLNPQQGDLAYQADAGELKIYVNGNWSVADRLIHTYQNQAARVADTPPDETFGFQRDTGLLYFRDNGAWVELGGGAGVVNAATQAARYGLAVTDVELGTLVYQEDTGVLWEYTGTNPPTAATIAAPASWTQITSVGATPKVIPVQNEAALPSAQAADADTSNPLYLVREDAAGNPFERLLLWRSTTPAQVPGQPAPTPSGVWVEVDSRNYQKDLQASADPTDLRRLGDLLATIQPDHAELKAFDGTAWQMLFSEDEIRQWVAAGSLFQGTVMPAPVAGGAVDLVQLPTPDSQWKGYYWTWTGPSSWVITDGTDIQADPNYNALTVTLMPAAPTAAGGPAVLQFRLAGPTAGVARTIDVELTTTGGNNPGHKRVTLAIDAADDEAAIVAKFIAAWNTPTADALDLQMAAAGNDASITFLNAATIISAMRHGADGATPVIGTDLTGQTMQVGDWLQVVTDPQGGYRWAHVPSDLLSKIRGDRLYSLQPWAAGNWERNSLVSYQCRIWRANANVGPTDPPPQLAGVPVTVIGQTLDAYPNAAADVNAWIAASPATGQNTGDYIVIDVNAAGTYNLPGGGTLTVNAADAILNTGNNLLGTEGYVVVPGPFSVAVSPARTISATPRTTAANPTGAIPIPSAARLQQRLASANADGQRLVITLGFVVPAGLPFAGTRLDPGDTLWWTADPANGDQGWALVKGTALGANDQPPWVPGTDVSQHITSAAVGVSPLANILQDMVNNGLQNGDVIQVTTAGILGVAAINAPANQHVANADFVIVTNAANNEFEYHQGPYTAGTGTQITVQATFRRGYGPSWNDPGADDISDVLQTRAPVVGDAYGYMGGGGAKTVPAAGWAHAGNMAGQTLPNTASVLYYLVCISTNPLVYVVEQAGVTTFPANGSALRNFSANVPLPLPKHHLSAAAGIAFTWADFAAHGDWSQLSLTDGAGNVQVSTLSQGSYIIVDEPTPAGGVPAGIGSGNIAGQTIAAGSRLYITSINPPRWHVVAAGQGWPQTGLLIEGPQPADPTTLTYAKPRTVTPPSPTPRATVPGIQAGASPWEEICVEGNFHSVLTDNQRPAGGAPGNQVFFVASSAAANNEPAFYSWVNNAWQRLGGEGGLKVVQTLPTTSNSGDAYYHAPTRTLWVNGGGGLVQVNAQPTGPVNSDGILAESQEGIFKFAAGAWRSGTTVEHDGKLWRAIEEVSAQTPNPGEKYSIVIPATNQVEQWNSDLDVAYTGTFGSGVVGNYVLIGNTDVSGPNLGDKFYGVLFHAGDRLVWSGHPELNGVTGNGWRVVHGVIVVPSGDALPVPATPVELDNNAWELIGPLGKGVTIGATEPTTPKNGDLWWDTTVATNPALRMWDGTIWAYANNVHFGQTAPANPIDGQIWWSTDTNHSLAPVARIYSVGQWRQLRAVITSPTAPADAISQHGDLWLDTKFSRLPQLNVRGEAYGGAKWIAQQPKFWDVYVTAPANARSHETTYTELNARSWGDFQIGVPIVIRELDANGQIPSMSSLPNLSGLKASPGDWLMTMDLDGNGTPDRVELIRHTQVMHTVDLANASGAGQELESLSPKAESSVEITGWIYVDGAASSKLELIGQTGGAWINWGTGFSAGDTGAMVLETSHNGTPSKVTLTGWDQAGAELGTIPWWNGRVLKVTVNLERIKVGTVTTETVVEWGLYGKDGNGNIRTSNGVVKLAQDVFPINQIGLKTDSAPSTLFRCKVKYE